MNKDFLQKLFDYIDARIDEKSAVDSSDGGLVESIQRRKIENELTEMCQWTT